MPKLEIQRPILANFRQRITTKFQLATQQPLQLSNTQIEMQVWQEIEAELLAISLRETSQVIQHPHRAKQQDASL